MCECKEKSLRDGRCVGGRESRTKEVEKRRGATRCQRGFDWAGGWQWRRGEERRGGAAGLLVLAAEEGSSLKAQLRYSWNEPGLVLGPNRATESQRVEKSDDYLHARADIVCFM